MSIRNLELENARLRQIIHYLEMRISAMEINVDLDSEENEYDLQPLPPAHVSPQVSIPGGGF